MAAARGSGSERWRLHRALGELLALVAGGRPLLLLVDDVHWADPATLELLEHLLRRPPADSLLARGRARPGPAAERLLAARRAGDAVGARRRSTCARSSARRPRRCSRDPEPERARTAVRAVRRQPAAAAASWRATAAPTPCPGGHRRGRPPRGRGAAGGRARARPAAAIAGDPFDLDLAARIAELDEPAALAALDVVERHGLIAATDDPRRFAFRHPVMRTAVHEALGAGARLAGHAAAARELARSGAPLAVRAQHLVHAAAPGDAAAAATLRGPRPRVRRQAPTVAADWLLAAGARTRPAPSSGRSPRRSSKPAG